MLKNPIEIDPSPLTNTYEETPSTDTNNEITDIYQLNDSTTIKFTQLNDSTCTDSIDDNKLAVLLNTPKHETVSSSTQSIESIHRTEACVFYVLSQLSHGDKPPIYLFNNFDSICTCLLSYLKHAPVRNPRALRILNRLTKNTYCFFNFVLMIFPYKLKSIFSGRVLAHFLFSA